MKKSIVVLISIGVLALWSLFFLYLFRDSFSVEPAEQDNNALLAIIDDCYKNNGVDCLYFHISREERPLYNFVNINNGTRVNAEVSPSGKRINEIWRGNINKIGQDTFYKNNLSSTLLSKAITPKEEEPDLRTDNQLYWKIEDGGELINELSTINGEFCIEGVEFYKGNVENNIIGGHVYGPSSSIGYPSPEHRCSDRQYGIQMVKEALSSYPKEAVYLRIDLGRL
jgi:hypothetical protein